MAQTTSFFMVPKKSRGKAARQPSWSMEKTDNILIKEVLDGSEQAFTTLVERYRERAYRVAYNFVHDFEEARDLTQEAFVKAYRSLWKFNQQKSFYTWFYRILVNLCVDHLRKHKRRNVYIEDIGDVEGGSSPEHQLVGGETRDNIYGILDALPDKYKTLIILRDVEGLSCLDIAKILKCSYTTVRWRLHRARNLFKEHWEKTEKKPPPGV